MMLRKLSTLASLALDTKWGHRAREKQRVANIRVSASRVKCGQEFSEARLGSCKLSLRIVRFAFTTCEVKVILSRSERFSRCLTNVDIHRPDASLRSAWRGRGLSAYTLPSMDTSRTAGAPSSRASRIAVARSAGSSIVRPWIPRASAMPAMGMGTGKSISRYLL